MFYIRPRRSWSTNTHVKLVPVRWRGTRRIERVHHTADSGLPSTATVAEEHAYLRRIEDFHIRTRGYAAIGYSYLVFPSGRVYEGRGFGKLGAHTLGHNEDVGVCFVGNFDKQKPTDAALRSERKLRARLRLHGVLIGQRVPHSATFATSCCGKYLKLALGMDV
jgi:N-acetylmuramoyl-L-alanine amidase